MAGPKTKWIIWYDDKSSFSNEDGEPWEAPRDGVICISQHHWSCGRLIMGEVDFYCWHFEDSEWVPHDRLGMMQYLRKPGKEKVVIEGYWVSQERFRASGGLARHDKRLPPKTAGEPPLPEGVRHYLED
jgi:hypothetical protein